METDYSSNTICKIFYFNESRVRYIECYTADTVVTDTYCLKFLKLFFFWYYTVFFIVKLLNEHN